jgi:predicted secreted protein
MGWITAIAVYFVVWWTVLFAVLPWGAHTPDETDAGKAAGAPAKPRIGLKFLVTTVIAAVVWLLIYLTISSGLISFRT